MIRDLLLSAYILFGLTHIHYDLKSKFIGLYTVNLA
jgi:hypothetical protein